MCPLALRGMLKERMDRELPVRRVSDEPPPFLGRWGRVYAVILGYLLVLILILYGVTRHFHY